MKPKFTPGPWNLVKKLTKGEFVAEYQIRDSENSFIAEIGPVSQDANSALIAAAPEMHDFIEKIVDANGPYTMLDGHSIVADAYAVLRKAKGEL